MKRSAALAIFGGMTALAALVTALLPRMDLSPSYHQFADQRTALGIPRFMDVVSNLPFLLVGLYGIAVVARRRRQLFVDSREQFPVFVLFLGVTLVAFGSGYYHLQPDNPRLFWDRLPMTVAFMGLVSAMIAERISVRLGLVLTPVLLLAGAASLLYWRWTDALGAPDLRPYGFVQAYPLLALILLLLLFPPRYTRSRDYAWVLALYVAAKLFEVGDRVVFRWTSGIVSGHTLKHLAAAAACYVLVRMVRDRVPLAVINLWAAAGR